MLGKIEGRRKRGRHRMRWLDGITDLMDMSLSKPGVDDGQGSLVCCSPWGHKESDTTEWLKWTELNWTELMLVCEREKTLVPPDNLFISSFSAKNLTSIESQRKTEPKRINIYLAVFLPKQIHYLYWWYLLLHPWERFSLPWNIESSLT